MYRCKNEAKNTPLDFDQGFHVSYLSFEHLHVRLIELSVGFYFTEILENLKKYISDAILIKRFVPC
jgi:hypothetical protein